MFDLPCNSEARGMAHVLGFPNSFSQLTKFSHLPGLEITKVPAAVPFPNVSDCPFQQMVANTFTSVDNAKETKEKMDIQKLLLQLPTLYEYFNVHKKIGEGTYSTVYLATLRNNHEKRRFAVKHLTQNFSLSRIQKELKFMQMIGGQDNVINVLNCFKSPHEDCVVFVMPYLEHKRFSDYVLFIGASELRLYMKNLFIALRRVHSFNVIHRDVKPGNFLYNRDKKEFLLVDFGLAQLVEREKRSSGSTDDENKPIDYSKRKRTASADEKNVTKMPLLSPLKSRENTLGNTNRFLASPALTPIQNTDRKPNRASVEKTPLKTKSHTSSSSLSSSSRKKLFCDELLNGSRTPLSVLPKSMNKSKIKFTSPGLRIETKDSRSFTPLVAKRSTSASFVQVRNSQVVTHKESVTCACTGEGTICGACRGKRAMAAPRAGTPGFRPPEVLLKYFHQTTAVDMWAAGVVMLCILSGCYPFFKSATDLAALAEIMTLFGTEKLREVAAKFGRRVACSSKTKPLDLRKMCRRLRKRRMSVGTYKSSKSLRKCKDCLQTITEMGCVCPSGEIGCDNTSSDGDIFPDSAYHLLIRLLDVDPATRITAEEALNHPFITGLSDSF